MKEWIEVDTRIMILEKSLRANRSSISSAIVSNVKEIKQFDSI